MASDGGDWKVGAILCSFIILAVALAGVTITANRWIDMEREKAANASKDIFRPGVIRPVQCDHPCRCTGSTGQTGQVGEVAK